MSDKTWECPGGSDCYYDHAACPTCGHDMEPQLVCEQCGKRVALPDEPTAGRRSAEPQPGGDSTLLTPEQPEGAVREDARTSSERDFKTLAQAEPTAPSVDAVLREVEHK